MLADTDIIPYTNTLKHTQTHIDTVNLQSPAAERVHREGNDMICGLDTAAGGRYETAMEKMEMAIWTT